ncbi:putative reverse transcriptase domain-containing protein [Tanacetum coccineum]
MDYIMPKYGKMNWKEDDSWSDIILNDIYNTFYKEPKVAKEPDVTKEPEIAKRTRGLRKKYRLNLKNDMPPRDNSSDHEDANEHIEKVLEIVDLFHIPNITIDQVMLRAFPMSLTGAASRWLRNKPSGSITTWEDLKTKFLRKYCPPACITKKIEEINNFQQEPDENLYQAWE